MMTRAQWVPLSEFAEVNPRKDVRVSDEETSVSFITMGSYPSRGNGVADKPGLYERLIEGIQRFERTTFSLLRLPRVWRMGRAVMRAV